MAKKNASNSSGGARNVYETKIAKNTREQGYYTSSGNTSAHVVRGDKTVLKNAPPQTDVVTNKTKMSRPQSGSAPNPVNTANQWRRKATSTLSGLHRDSMVSSQRRSDMVDEGEHDARHVVKGVKNDMVSRHRRKVRQGNYTATQRAEHKVSTTSKRLEDLEKKSDRYHKAVKSSQLKKQRSERASQRSSDAKGVLTQGDEKSGLKSLTKPKSLVEDKYAKHADKQIKKIQREQAKLKKDLAKAKGDVDVLKKSSPKELLKEARNVSNVKDARKLAKNVRKGMTRRSSAVGANALGNVRAFSVSSLKNAALASEDFEELQQLKGQASRLRQTMRTTRKVGKGSARATKKGARALQQRFKKLRLKNMRASFMKLRTKEFWKGAVQSLGKSFLNLGAKAATSVVTHILAPLGVIIAFIVVALMVLMLTIPSCVDHLDKQVLESTVARAENSAVFDSYTENYNYIPGSGNDHAVQRALSQLGVKYVWGGTTPGVGLDCSGLCQWAWADQVALPRVSRDQFSWLQQRGRITTDIGRLRAGDLVFFGNPVHHVGMYLGNGDFVHAPHTGDVVKVSKLSGYYARNFRGGGSPL